MRGLTLHDVANEVAACLRSLADRSAVLLGQAFGDVFARVVTTDHPALVRAVVLAAAEGSKVPEDISSAPGIVSDPAVRKPNVTPYSARRSSRPALTRASGSVVGITTPTSCSTRRRRPAA